MWITSAVPPLDPNRRYPLDQANQYLGQSRAKTYQGIAKENLRVIKDGSRTYNSRHRNHSPLELAG